MDEHKSMSTIGLKQVKHTANFETLRRLRAPYFAATSSFSLTMGGCWFKGFFNLPPGTCRPSFVLLSVSGNGFLLRNAYAANPTFRQQKAVEYIIKCNKSFWSAERR